MRARMSWFNLTSVTLGLAFLYLPMLLVVVYSFNESRLVTIWTGFSTRWYGALWENENILNSALISLRIGLISSTLATVLGTMAAFVMVRAGRFVGRTLFSGLIFAPLVMPDVISGLAMLLLFISVDLDRGIVTIVMAQVTLQMCFVCVVVSSRLAEHDRALDEAALDLGCTPLQAFCLVTLPSILPGVISAWLLAFSMSLDDLVVASFTSGPASTTLPIRVFSAARTGVTPEINALSTLMIGVVTFGIVAASLIGGHRRRQRLRRSDRAEPRFA